MSNSPTTQLKTTIYEELRAPGAILALEPYGADMGKLVLEVPNAAGTVNRTLMGGTDGPSFESRSLGYVFGTDAAMVQLSVYNTVFGVRCESRWDQFVMDPLPGLADDPEALEARAAAVAKAKEEAAAKVEQKAAARADARAAAVKVAKPATTPPPVPASEPAAPVAEKPAAPAVKKPAAPAEAKPAPAVGAAQPPTKIALTLEAIRRQPGITRDQLAELPELEGFSGLARGLRKAVTAGRVNGDAEGYVLPGMSIPEDPAKDAFEKLRDAQLTGEQVPWSQVVLAVIEQAPGTPRDRIVELFTGVLGDPGRAVRKHLKGHAVEAPDGTLTVTDAGRAYLAAN